jgi:trk system potassium uptake protein
MYAIIAGGGKVGFFLARELIEQGNEILIIENNPERAETIANELGNVVLRGNADEASTLAEAGAERADVVIAVTGDDEDNLVLCQVAKRRFGTRRTIARINDPRNESLFRMLGIDATVNATQMMLSVLEQEIPPANLVPLLRLRNTDVEVVEAIVDPQSRVTGTALREVDLPPESTIAVVIRNGSAFFPNGATVLQPGDEIVALTRGIHEPRLRSLFFSEHQGR